MTLNGILEIMWIRGWILYEEFQCRYTKKTSVWAKILLLAVSISMDLLVYSSSVHPELFSPVGQMGMKALGMGIIAISRIPFFVSGVWSTYTLCAILDFFVGISVILRYFTFYILGLDLGNYTVDNFRLMPLLILILFGVLIHFTLVRWLLRFREGINYPGIVLKVMNVFYWIPTLAVIRPMDVLDLSNSVVVLMSSVSGVVVVIFGWIYLIRYSRQIYNENHYLALQADLFKGHNELLKEQVQLLQMCRAYLQKAGPGVDAITNFKESQYWEQQQYTRNGMLDTAISNKIRRCQENKIQVIVQLKEFELPSEIQELHFLTIFYNLFDNAMEAANQCEMGKRYIWLSGAYLDKEVHLTIKNSVTMENGRNYNLLTTKKDKQNHGLGLKIVGDIVKRYHGQYRVEQEKECFTAEIILPKNHAR